MVQGKIRASILAVVAGNMLEWYDAALYAFLAPLFAEIFFPKDHAHSFFAEPLFFFALSSLVRPVGSYVLGYVGDRYGRKEALILSIACLTVPIFFLGILPSYETVGNLTLFVLVFVCLVQGFCTGGEFPGAVSYLTEQAPKRQKAYVGSFAYFGVLLGMLLGTADLLFLNHHMSREAFVSWGWRIPFFIGTALGIAAFTARFFVGESDEFMKIKRAGEICKAPLTSLFVRHKKLLFLGCALFLLDAFGFNILFVLSTTYFRSLLHLPFNVVFQINAFTLVVALSVLPLAGKLAEHIGAHRLGLYSAFTLFFSAYPAYLLIGQGSLPPILAGQLFLAVPIATFFAVLPEILHAFFPVSIRYTGIAMVMSFSVMLFGGPTPLILSYLVEKSQVATLPSFFLMGGALVSGLTVHHLMRRYSHHI